MEKKYFSIILICGSNAIFFESVCEANWKNDDFNWRSQLSVGFVPLLSSVKNRLLSALSITSCNQVEMCKFIQDYVIKATPSQ